MEHLKSDMNAILAAINSANEGTYSSVDTAETTSFRSAIDPDTAAMKNILTRLTEATDNVVTNDFLKEEVQTELTETGSRVGSWEIRFKDGKPKTYDVISTRTGEALASDLFLYEAGLALVRLLNEGISITDKRVRKVLELEESYTKNRMEAAHFKKRYKSYTESGEMRRAEICEHRHQEASRQALHARNQVSKLAGLD